MSSIRRTIKRDMLKKRGMLAHPDFPEQFSQNRRGFKPTPILMTIHKRIFLAAKRNWPSKEVA